MSVRPDQVAVVLCHPSDPRNIGSCVRAVANFGLAGLRLVTHEPVDRQAIDAYASGSLERVRFDVFDQVQAALTDAAWVLGTSRRHHAEDGPLGWPLPDLGTRLAGRAPVCVLFGHERSGLSREELDFCDAVVSIPTSDVFPSMNLSHAVACLGYELARPDPSAWAAPGRPRRVRALDRDAVFREIAAVCEEIGFPPGRTPLHFARRLRRLLARADATSAEMSLVAGVFRELRRLAGEAQRTSNRTRSTNQPGGS